MIVFEMRKPKALSMPALVEGIEPSHLRFKFVIEANGVDYGFHAVMEGDNIKFVIPALETVVCDLQAGIYKAKLEVSALTEGDKGFYMQPWGEEVRIKQSVKVQVAEAIDPEPEKVEEVKTVNLKLAAMFSEENIEGECDEPEEKKEKKEKNSAMRKKLLN
jgi:hypothetical protein